MVDTRKLRLLLPPRARRFPADLTVVLALTAATCLAVLLPAFSGTGLRVALGLAFAFIAPGYALTAALFPERAESSHESEREGDSDDAFLRRVRRGTVGGWERLALSIGLSLAVVPLVGMVLNFTPPGIRLVPVVVSIGAFTVGAAVFAAVRRWNVPAERRFRVPYRRWYATARAGLFSAETRTDQLLNVALAVSLVLAVGSVGYAIAGPKPDEQYTEFYLLSPDDGELIASDYPAEFVRGEEEPLTVGITNNEGERTEYAVVVELQRVERDASGNASRVVERRDLHRFRTALGPNETWHRDHTVTPPMTGENLRLQYLLYRGDPPTEPRAENAYRTVHVPVDVSTPQNDTAARLSVDM